MGANNASTCLIWLTGMVDEERLDWDIRQARVRSTLWLRLSLLVSCTKVVSLCFGKGLLVTSVLVAGSLPKGAYKALLGFIQLSFLRLAGRIMGIEEENKSSVIDFCSQQEDQLSV